MPLSPLTAALNQSDQTASTLNDLKTALTQTLKYNGTYSKLEAAIRTEVYKTLTNPGNLEGGAPTTPNLPNDNLMLNSLILEYLQFNNYGQTASILVAESGHPTTKNGADGSGLERDFIMSDLNVRNSSSTQKVPVLYGVVSKLRELKLEGITSNANNEAVPSKKMKERKRRTKKFVKDIAGGLARTAGREGEVGGNRPEAIEMGGY